MEKTVAFSGHRPEKIKVPISILSTKLDETLLALYERGFRTFLSGMARGFDMLAAEAALRLREKHAGVRLVAVIPFMGQELMYNRADRERYDEIYHSADSTIFTSYSYATDAYFIRNEYLLDHSSMLICYHAGTEGVTKDTVNRAYGRGVGVINLHLD